MLTITGSAHAQTGLTGIPGANIIFAGKIHIPVLTMRTDGDGLVVAENDSIYNRAVREAGNIRFLRETFVHRAGHCSFAPAETITALQNLIQRLETGKWPDFEPKDLNGEAATLGPPFNVFAFGQPLVDVPPAFFEFKPAPFLRAFDARSSPCESHHECDDRAGSPETEPDGP